MKTTELKKMTAQALEQLADALEQGRSEQLESYLAMLGRFHRYSACNVLLISLQRPDATRVAGYRTWQKLGRQVKQGEQGIRILAPILWRKKVEEDSEDEQERILSFKPAYVFDVSQTEGEPLPEFATVCGEPGEALARLEALIAGRGIRLEHTNAIGPAQGASIGGRIYLRTDLAPAEAFSTLVHELAHEMLHQQDGSERPDKTVRETEAEGVAFVVCQAMGLEAGNAARDYIQLYSGDKEMLLSSLERIRQTAVGIIQGIAGQEEKADGMPSLAKTPPRAVAA